MAPIINSIYGQIKTNISGLTVAGGYSSDWGTVNEYDFNKMTFPAAVVTLPDEESNQDEAFGVHAQAYTNVVPIYIQIYDALATQETYPEDEIKLAYWQDLDDLKKIFGTDFFLGGHADRIMYRTAKFIKSRSGDIFTPATMMTRWDVYYTQDRIDPETPGG